MAKNSFVMIDHDVDPGLGLRWMARVRFGWVTTFQLQRADEFRVEYADRICRDGYAGEDAAAWSGSGSLGFGNDEIAVGP
jgi:hypothetical protein